MVIDWSESYKRLFSAECFNKLAQTTTTIKISHNFLAVIYQGAVRFCIITIKCKFEMSKRLTIYCNCAGWHVSYFV